MALLSEDMESSRLFINDLERITFIGRLEPKQLLCLLNAHIDKMLLL